MRELLTDPILKARAEALFREAAKQVRTDAVSDYRAKKATELEKMASEDRKCVLLPSLN